ncbi:MAG TPA: hypothetical protein VM364_12680 [Vicinamibacterales bacterium]|nr:hypothetical protein [Vicinamibacterales bacterium]
MRLDSARGLKQQLLQDVIDPFTEQANLLRTEGVAAVAAAMRVRGMAGDPSSFGIGAKRTATLPQVQRSIALGVAPKGPEYRLAVRVQRAALRDSPLVERVTREARGEVDVQLVGRIDKRQRRAPARPWYQSNQRPLLIGSSIAHVAVTAGTLGAFVMKGRAVHVLSNNHVLADENRAAKGDVVLQRAHFDGGRRRDAVGRVTHWIALKPRGSNTVDAALASVDAGIGHDPVRLRGLVGGADRRLAGLGPEFIDEDAVVYKVGRTTGPTRGRVTAFDMDNVVVNFDIGNVRFDGQIEIEGHGRSAFSDGGDSGSLIVDGEMRAVALLFAGSESGGSNDAGLTYANPIHAVLKALKATLLP